jgi:tetratricopeptide (TPR) repeat protein
MLALQMDFVDQSGLITAMQAWILNKSQPLGEILMQAGKMGRERHALLEALVQEHLRQHQNNPQQSLAALTPDSRVAGQLRSLMDGEVEASLAHYGADREPADPYATLSGSGRTEPADGMRYRFLRPHAQGGLGEVSVALDQELNREVALKQIKSPYERDRSSCTRFLREAQVTGALEHPGIVPVYGLGHYGDGRPYYAMRFIRGDSLKDAIEEFHRSGQDYRSSEFRQLLGRFIDVCNAIQYAHSRGVLHRDLKPGNIMLGKYGETLVVDWGLAMVLGQPDAPSTEEPPLQLDGENLSRQGAILGTAAFMSPEQATGRLDLLGPHSDVYGLGATLYALLTNKAPATGNSNEEVLHQVRGGKITPPRTLQPKLPRGLEAICLKAMAPQIDDRYLSPADLADDLERWLADERVRAYREPWIGRVARWSRRNRAWTLAAALALCAVTLVSAASAVLIGRARAREAEAFHLSSLRRDLSLALDTRLWTAGDFAHQLAQTEGLLAGLEEVAPDEAQQNRERLQNQWIKFIRDQIQVPRLAADDRSEIESQLSLLAARDALAAGELKAALDARAGSWQPLALLQAPFADAEAIGQVFDAPLISVSADTQSLARNPQTKAMDQALTRVSANGGTLAAQATFDGDWSRVYRVGIALGDPSAQPYLFQITAPEFRWEDHAALGPEELEREGVPSLGRCLAEQRPVTMTIARADTPLRQTNLLLPAPRVQIDAEMVGDRLRMRVNDFAATLDYEDLLSLGVGGEGRVGLWWPAGLRLTRLEVREQALPLAASPLERADTLFARGEYSAALTALAEAANTAGDEELSAEIRYKQALCQSRLADYDTAIEQLEKLLHELEEKATPATRIWRLRAICQLWFLLETAKLDEIAALEIFDHLPADVTAADMARLVSAKDRQAILDQHARYGAAGRLAWQTELNQELDQLEIAVRVNDTLNDDPLERRTMRWRLFEAYRIAGKQDAALALAETLLADPDLTPAEIVGLTRDTCWMLRQMDQSPRAVELLTTRLEQEQVLAGQPTPRALQLTPLLIERARALAAQGDLVAAEQDVERFFQCVDKAQINYSDFAGACALQGFLREERGDRDGAQAAWREGLLIHWPAGLRSPLKKGRLLSGVEMYDRDNSIRYNVMLGSLTGELSLEESDRMQNALFQGSGMRSSTLNVLKDRNFTPEFVHQALLKSYQVPHGRQLARRMALLDLDLVEYYQDPIKLHVGVGMIHGCELWDPLREEPGLEGELWSKTGELFALFNQGGLSDDNLKNLLQLWKGARKPEATWSQLAPSLEPNLRVPAAYIFGRRYGILKRPDDALRFLRDGQEHGPSGTVFDSLIATELARPREAIP